MEHVIDADNLTLSYGRDEPIITEANMKINPNEFVFITGKSGSGKSTILKSMYGELTPSKGDLNVCGVNIKNINSTKLNLLRRYLGIVFQDYRLVNDWTVEKNVMLPLMIGGFSKGVCVKQAQKLLSDAYRNGDFGLLKDILKAQEWNKKYLDKEKNLIKNIYGI